MERPEVNGEQPEVAGLECEELKVLECWRDGVLVEPASLIFIRVAGIWHRLHYAHGVIVWRTVLGEPMSLSFPTTSRAFEIVDVAERHNLKGQIMAGLECGAEPRGSSVCLRFEAGGHVTVRCPDDVTTYEVS